MAMNSLQSALIPTDGAPQGRLPPPTLAEAPEVWRVVRANAAVRENDSTDSNILGVKYVGNRVHGWRRDEWFKLSEEAGFIKIDTAKGPLLEPCHEEAASPSQHNEFHSPEAATPVACSEAEAPAGQPIAGGAAAKRRLIGLDMLRGLTLLVMFTVDYLGDVYTGIGHAPWDGVRLADFVMPCFLWVSGASIAASLRVSAGSTRGELLGKALMRGVRLFLLGVLLQGEWFQQRDDAQVLQLDLRYVRIMGILQHIAITTTVVSIVELYVPDCCSFIEDNSASPEAEGSPRFLCLRLFRTNAFRWLAIAAVLALGTVLTYGMPPPHDWPGCAETLYVCSRDLGSDPGEKLACTGIDKAGTPLQSMGCSGAGYWDSIILGLNHVYTKGSSNTTGPLTWGFDPEGLIASFAAVTPVFLGLHTGKVWATLREPLGTVIHQLILGALLLLLGAVLSLVVPLNKRLWSPSFNFLTCGVSTLVYTALFAAVDAPVAPHRPTPAWSQWARWFLTPLQWLGCNSILFFVLGDHMLVEFLTRTIVWGRPASENNLFGWLQQTVLMQWLGLGTDCEGYDECGPARIAFWALQLAVWLPVLGVLHRKKIFFKI